MDTPSRPKDAAQSFIIRLWQERPRQWRGTVRHVQSDAQRGFSKLDQAVSFIEQRAAAETQTAISPAVARAESAPAPIIDLTWLTARRMRPVYALAGLALIVVLALLLASPSSNIPLSGAAVASGVGWEYILAFLVGVVLGGLGVGLWLRSADRVR